jgi:hydrogenase maturation protease
MRDIEQAISDRLQRHTTLADKKNILILGIGNYLMGDEGIGVQYIHDIIKNKIDFPDADVLDGGVGGFALMSCFDDYDHVIIIDATMDGNSPGTISLIQPKFASDFPKALSAHDFGLKDMVESMYLLGRVPAIYLFTVSIPSIKPMCLALSPDVQASIPILHEKIRKHIHKIGLPVT